MEAITRSSTALSAAALAALLACAPVVAAPAPDAVADHIKASDTNHDGMESAAEHAAYAKKRFDAMDADHNGRVTTAEIDAARKNMLKGKTAIGGVSAATRIKTMDTDADGMLSAEESAAAAQQSFNGMDANHDGQLTSDELHVGNDAGMVADSPLPDSN